MQTHADKLQNNCPVTEIKHTYTEQGGINVQIVKNASAVQFVLKRADDFTIVILGIPVYFHIDIKGQKQNAILGRFQMPFLHL